MGKAVLKAGLIGLVVLVALTLINQFVIRPGGAMIYVMCGVSVIVYLGLGVLAAWFLPPERSPGKGAAAGALAGLSGQAVSGALGVTISLIRIGRTGVIPGTTPEQMEALAELNWDPSIMMIPGAVCGLIIAIGVSAIGGGILAALKPD